MKLNTLMFW